MNLATSLISNQQSRSQIFKDISSSLISTLSSEMFAFALGLLLLATTHSAISFGIDLIISPLVSLLFMVPVGVITDRYRHKIILSISILFRLLALIIFLLTLDLFTGNFKLIPVVSFLTINAITNNFSTTAYASSVHELVNPCYLQKLSSLTQSAASLSSIFAPLLGAFLYSLAGFELFIYLEIAATIISFLIMSSMHFHYATKPVKKSASSLFSLKDFKKVLRYSSVHPLIQTIMLISIVINFLLSAFNIGLPYVIIDQLHHNSSAVAVLEAAISVGVLGGSLAMSISKNKNPFLSKMLISLLISGGCTVLFGNLIFFIKNRLAVILLGSTLMLILGISISVVNLGTKVYLQTNVPTIILGKIFSLLQTAATISMPLGILFYTLIFQTVNNGAAVFIFSGLIMISYLILLNIFLPKELP